jgi:hypothetical protein
MKDFRTLSLTDELLSVAECGVGGLAIRGFNIINPNNTDVYVKFFDNFDSDITLGTTKPNLTLLVPANGSIVEAFDEKKTVYFFSTNIAICAVTGLADSSTTAPDSGVYVQLYYNV